MTSDNFSPARCASVIGLYVTENKRTILLSIASIFGILTLLAIFAMLKTNYNYPVSYSGVTYDRALMMLPTYIILGYIFSALACSIAFMTLKSKQGRIHTLMVPANASEKLLARIIIFMIAFPVMYILLLCCADSVRCLIVSCTNHVVEPMPVYVALFNPQIRHIILTNDPIAIRMAVLGFFALQSFFLLGSVIWPRLSSLKTFAVFTAIGLFYAGTAVWLSVILSKNRMTYISSGYNGHEIAILTTIGIAAILFNLAMTWMRLRETDVITTKR